MRFKAECTKAFAGKFRPLSLWAIVSTQLSRAGRLPTAGRQCRR